jgi:DNA-binding NtrC family response regulator
MAPLRSQPEQLVELERRAIGDALAATGGNKLAAAKLLGIARATLYEKLALYRGEDGMPGAVRSAGSHRG